jgi:hypothetical protein
MLTLLSWCRAGRLGKDLCSQGMPQISSPNNSVLVIGRVLVYSFPSAENKGISTPSYSPFGSDPTKACAGHHRIGSPNLMYAKAFVMVQEVVDGTFRRTNLIDESSEYLVKARGASHCRNRAYASARTRR